MEFYIGQEKRIRKVIDEEAVNQFAEVSGDCNPLHINEEYAQKSIFGKRIAHGILSVSYISAVLGNEFPGVGTIYMEQHTKFLKPIYFGETVEILVRIKDIKGNKAVLQTDVIKENGEIAVEGEALVRLP